MREKRESLSSIHSLAIEQDGAAIQKERERNDRKKRSRGGEEKKERGGEIATTWRSGGIGGRRR